MDGEIYGCVKTVNTFDGDDGADLAATYSIRNGWMKSSGRFCHF